tara:strand:+ start:77 stop:274 length:198 start_codon:yes stop_codon:yes gene_type:complete
MYKSRLKKGRAFFLGGLHFNWEDATQEQLQSVYEMGYHDLVKKEEDAKPKKTKSKAKAKDNSDKE